MQTSSPRSIQLLVALTCGLVSAAAIGWVLVDPVFPQPEVQPSGRFDPADANYVGPEEPILKWSKVYSTLPRQSQEAFRRLATSKVFAASNLGLGGPPAPQGEAFRTLLKESRAIDVFSELAYSGQPNAQLYGLAGLFALDQERFRRVSRRFRFSRAEVWTWSGCIVSEKKIPIVIDEFSSGYWVQQLSRAQ